MLILSLVEALAHVGFLASLFHRRSDQKGISILKTKFFS